MTNIDSDVGMLKVATKQPEKSGRSAIIYTGIVNRKLMYCDSSSINVFFRNTTTRVSKSKGKGKGKHLNCTMMVPQELATRTGVNLNFGAHKADPYLSIVLCTRGLAFWFVGSFFRISFRGWCSLGRLARLSGFRGLLRLLNTISKHGIHKRIHAWTNLLSNSRPCNRPLNRLVR